MLTVWYFEISAGYLCKDIDDSLSPSCSQSWLVIVRPSVLVLSKFISQVSMLVFACVMFFISAALLRSFRRRYCITFYYITCYITIEMSFSLFDVYYIDVLFWSSAVV